MSTNDAHILKTTPAKKNIKSLLKVSIGGRLVPILVLLATLIGFIAYWLPSGREMLANSLERLCNAARPGIVGLAVRDNEPSKKQKAAGQKPIGVVVEQASDYWMKQGIKSDKIIAKVDGKQVNSRQEFIDAVLAPSSSVHEDCAGQPGAETRASGPRACITLGETSTLATVPGAPKSADGKWAYEPKHYRDLCADPRGPLVSLIKDDVLKREKIWTEDFALQSFPVSVSPRDIFIGLFAYAKLFFDDVASAMGAYWWMTLTTLASAALFALLPGIGGLIYRRAFWSWYILSFIIFLALTYLARHLTHVKLGETNETASALAVGIFLFLIVQLGLLLLANRLRRHSVRMPLIGRLVPVRLYNYTVIAVLLVLAYGLGFLGWGDRIWGLPFMPFENTTWTKWNVILLGIPFLYAILKISPAWTGKKPKNIVVLLDGTSNTPDQLDMGQAAQTNVFKLFSMLKSDGGAFAPHGRFDATLCKTYDDRQVGFYYTGIGNSYDSDPLVGTLSQATGLGATGIIERAYLDVMRVWRPGDRVFIYGFSRGAASARILARVIDQRGAPKSVWSLRLFGRHWTLLPSKSKQEVQINVLGCWDTVGSFGVSKTIAGINFQQLNLLHDLTVPENVKQAYHMVALDEQRQEFEPTLMDPDPFRPHRMVEVWFSGDHAGVGGGWATDRQSDVALEFLLKRVSSGYCSDGTTQPGDESWGMYLSAADATNEAALAQAGSDTTLINPDPLGQLRSYFSSVYNYRSRTLPLHAVISDTVFERMTRSLPVYAPQALFDLNDALDAKRDLITTKVKKLEETQSMDEDERSKVLDFAARLRLTRFTSHWERVLEEHNAEAGSIEPSHSLANN